MTDLTRRELPSRLRYCADCADRMTPDIFMVLAVDLLREAADALDMVKTPLPTASEYDGGVLAARARQAFYDSLDRDSEKTELRGRDIDAEQLPPIRIDDEVSPLY